MKMFIIVMEMKYKCISYWKAGHFFMFSRFQKNIVTMLNLFCFYPGQASS